MEYYVWNISTDYAIIFKFRLMKFRGKIKIFFQKKIIAILYVFYEFYD